MDLSSDEAGTVRKVVSGNRVYADRLKGLDLAAAHADGQMLFTLHATTCRARRGPRSGRRPDHLTPSPSSR
ncbi:MAG: hypothetical protein QM809_11370 [Gordonia sp. (in: high G+C Gram-positive bacteria)]|uniref:hypothetical protein n=1 Tax=Gordonia sp. (in: high G+C Gram-positive bacteria) TaxID=84139 RepID=UPI0039E567A0